ncbi:MAG: kelch repeat-containing protein [Methanomassiliicoccales archaeon]
MCLVPSAEAADTDWVVSDTSPIDRLVYAYAELPDGRIFVAAGADVSDMALNDETWIYDPQVKQWAQVADCPYSVESSCSVAMPDGNVYLFGGMDGPMLENALVYQVANDTWGEGQALPTDLLIAEAVALDDHRILIAGGLAGMFFNNCTKQCWIYDTVADDFTAAADMPADRCCGMMAAYAGKAFYFGGTNAMSTSCDDIFTYDIAADEWSAVGHLPDNLLNAAVVAGGYGNIYLIGGEDQFSWYSEGSVRAYSYDTITGIISMLPDLSVPVLNAAAFVLDDGMLMYMLGNNYTAGNTDIFTLQTGEVMASLSAAEVDQGDSVWLHVWVDTELDIGTVSGVAYLIKDNITYGEWHFSMAENSEVVLEIALSEELPAGNYALVLHDVNAEGWWLEWHAVPMPLAVMEAPSTQDRLDALEQQNQDLMDQNAAMQDKLDGLEQQNNDLAVDLAELKEANDAKMDAMIGYAILIVAIGALVVGIIVLVRKK